MFKNLNTSGKDERHKIGPSVRVLVMRAWPSEMLVSHHYTASQPKTRSFTAVKTSDLAHIRPIRSMTSFSIKKFKFQVSTFVCLLLSSKLYCKMAAAAFLPKI